MPSRTADRILFAIVAAILLACCVAVDIAIGNWTLLIFFPLLALGLAVALSDRDES